MVRSAAASGMFYPKEKEELRALLERFLQEAEEFSVKGKSQKLRALIVPHAGYVYSGPVAAQGYKLLEKHKFQKVVLMGPSHYLNFYGASIAEEDFQTPLGIVKCGKASSWTRESLIEVLPEAQVSEHSLEVQLPFLQETLGKSFELYALVLGTVNEEKLAKVLAELVNEDTLVIASSDLSHYLPYGQAVIRDNDTIGKILSFDPGKLDACGRVPIRVLMHLASLKGWKPFLIDYRNSGDTAGDKSRVVGYAAIGYYGE